MQTFSDILQQYFRESYEIFEASKAYITFERDCGISKRTFIGYFTGKIVPSYTSARKVLNAMEFDMSEKELNKCLEMSKIASQKSSPNYKKFVTLNSSDFGLPTTELLAEAIQKRMADKNLDSFSQYITGLIKKDIGL